LANIPYKWSADLTPMLQASTATPTLKASATKTPRPTETPFPTKTP
jgi:hypothetical protein